MRQRFPIRLTGPVALTFLLITIPAGGAELFKATDAFTSFTDGSDALSTSPSARINDDQGGGFLLADFHLDVIVGAETPFTLGTTVGTSPDGEPDMWVELGTDRLFEADVIFDPVNPAQVTGFTPASTVTNGEMTITGRIMVTGGDESILPIGEQADFLWTFTDFDTPRDLGDVFAGDWMAASNVLTLEIPEPGALVLLTSGALWLACKRPRSRPA